MYIHMDAWFVSRGFRNTGAVFFILFPCEQLLNDTAHVLNIRENILKTGF